MHKTKIASMVLAVVLSGCGSEPLRPAFIDAAAPNCGISLTACVIVVTADESGLSPKFFVSVDPAIPPSNATTPIDVYWLLPPGYAFYEGDGVTLGGNSSFSNPRISGFFDQRRPPGSTYIWTLAAGAAVVNQKYKIVFHQATAMGAGKQWACDPVIYSFDSYLTRKPVKLASVSLVCT